MKHKVKHVHFVGIGGIGMSGIAEVLLNLDYRVSGSDLNESAVTQHLQTLGATVYKGHAEEHIAEANAARSVGKPEATREVAEACMRMAA